MFRPFPIPRLLGLNEDENPSALQPGQLRNAFNCCRYGSLTGTRPGLVYDSEYTAALAGTPAVQGIHEFRKDRDATRRLVTVAGGEVYYDSTSGALTKSSASISSGQNYYWTFASYQNNIWAAGGNVGTDDIWTWDGNPANPVTGRLGTLSPNIYPRYVFEKFGTLFLGGFVGASAVAHDNPLVARYCNYAEDATDPLSWPNENTIPGATVPLNPGVGSYGEEYGTGFGSYQDNRGDFLMFLTNKRILSFTLNPSVTGNANRFVLTDAIANGCVDQRAFVDLGYDQGDAIYLSSSGVHSLALSQQFGNRENSFLSWPIRKTWETINQSRLKYARTAYWPNEGIVLFLVSTGSNSNHNLILCLDIKGATKITPDTVRWYKWYLNLINANEIAVGRDPSNGQPRIYFGGTAGQVAPFTRAAYSDLGATISTSFRTKDEDLNDISSEKGIGDTYVDVYGAGTHSPVMKIVADYGSRTSKPRPLTLAANTSQFGTGIFGSSKFGSNDSVSHQRIPGLGSAFTVAHQFQHAGANEAFFIGSISQDYDYSGRSDEATE